MCRMCAGGSMKAMSLSSAEALVSARAASEAEAPSLTAIILCFNEEIHLERCLTRLKGLAQRMVVIDSYSTDRSVEIARAHGAEVLQNPWTNHATQFQWALDHAEIRTDWVMKIDCDEYLEPGLIETLRRRLPEMPPEVTGLVLRLKVIFRGRFMRHGRAHQTRLLRVWRAGLGHMEQRWMDEHVVLSHGKTISIGGGDLVDHNLKDITWWTDKHNGYATRHMLDYINREYSIFEEDTRLSSTKAPARFKRFLKNGVYGRAPLYLRAALFFLYRYIFRLGFLDGKEGFVWHFLQGFWIMALIDAKIDEARAFIRLHGLDAFKEHVRARHGFSL